MHEIGRFKIMITPRRKIKAEAKLQQTRERNKRKKIKAEAAAKQAEHIAFETEAKCTKAAAAEAAPKETISDLPTDFFNLKVIWLLTKRSQLRVKRGTWLSYN
jgi:hypothetical protein